jgi:dihydroneopterin aldolase
MAIPSQLLEHVAGRVVKAVAEAFPAVTAIDLELLKQNPPMGADCDGAGVEMHWER